MDDDAIIGQVLADLQAEFGADLLGVLATGSRMRGEGDHTSDIDLHVVIQSPRRQRRNVIVGGVEVEIFINPPFQILRYFDLGRESGRGVDQHMWSTARTIYDPRGVIAELTAEAQTQWNAGPPPVDGNDWRIRYLPADMLRDVTDVIDRDLDQAIYLIGGLVGELIDIHYRLQGRWRVKGKRILQDLASWDSTAADLVRRTYSGSAALRFAATQSLLEHVLAPVGGPMPLAWRTDWEDLDP